MSLHVEHVSCAQADYLPLLCGPGSGSVGLTEAYADQQAERGT
jgi:hypothetical protein